eukprot:m51a1_g299 putative alpha-mannosidase 2x (1188) ;mRNA; f:365928-371159
MIALVLVALLAAAAAGAEPAEGAPEAREPTRTWEAFNAGLALMGDAAVPREPWDPSAFGGRPLRVFVVPWSHNEPGWKLTFSHYFTTQSSKILDNVVAALDRRPERHFVWVESAVLQRWYAQTSEANKALLRKLVRRGQFEVATGGWVMADEALSHYEALVEQLVEGHDWLIRALGVRPRTAMSVDVAGHSPTMAYLLASSGIRGVVLHRIHHAVKKELARTHSLEFVWRQTTAAAAGGSDLVAHVLPYAEYDVAHTCGPDARVCASLDFSARRNAAALATPEGVREAARRLVEQYRGLAAAYASPVVLVPLGGDFAYAAPDELEAQYSAYQRLFDEINGRPAEYNAAVRFANLSDWLDALGEEQRQQQRALPVVQGDFFPYADARKDYWTGFYSNRPFFKRAARILFSTTRGVQALFTLLSTWNREPADKDDVPMSITHARRAYSIYSHHAGITGLSAKAVVRDYGRMMHEARWEMKASLLLLVQHALSIEGNPELPPQEDFEPDESKSRSSELPIPGILRIPPSEELRPLIVYNSLPQTRPEVISVITDSPFVIVREGSTDAVVPSQVCPVVEYAGDSFKPSEGKYQLTFVHALPPMSITTFFVVSSDARDSEGAAVPCEALALHGRPLPSWLGGRPSAAWPEDQRPCIGNGAIRACFDANGMVASLAGPDVPEFACAENYLLYRSGRSGPFVFSPDKSPETLVKEPVPSIVLRGPIVEEVITRVGPSVTRSIRAYKTAHTTLSAYFDVAHQLASNGGDLALEYRTALGSGDVFFTDNNGFTFTRRASRADVPAGGNLYPVSTTLFVQDDARRLSVHTAQPLGATCAAGACALLLDRYTTRDDGKGLTDRMDDALPTRTLTRVVVEAPLALAAPATSLLSHAVRTRLNHPLQYVFGKTTPAAQWQERYGVAVAPLTADLPEDVSIVSLRKATTAVDAGEYTVILARAVTTPKSPPADDEPACVSLAELYRCADVVDVTEHSLTFMHEHSEAAAEGGEGVVCMRPGTIRAFTFNVKIDAECQPPGVPSPALAKWAGAELDQAPIEAEATDDPLADANRPAKPATPPGVSPDAKPPAVEPATTTTTTEPATTRPAEETRGNVVPVEQQQQPAHPPLPHIEAPVQQQQQQGQEASSMTNSVFLLLFGAVVTSFVCYRKKKISSSQAVFLLSCIICTNAVIVLYSTVLA